MKKILIIIFVAVCAGTSAIAQSNFAATYSMGFGTGDLGDFISAPSFRGIALDYRYSIQPNIALGLNFGMNTFYEARPNDTYTADNVSLTGKQYRYSNHVPMLATATYFLKPGEKLGPFATVGLGTMYTRRNTDMNLYTVEQEAWNFVVQPEIGIQYKVLDMMALHVSAKYMLGFEAGNDLPETQSFISLNVGLCFLSLQ
jgi:opacity protein-like surface antigen